MKIRLYAFVSVALMLLSLESRGQAGWLWAVGSTLYGGTGAYVADGAVTAVDRAGNVFCAGAIANADSATFGPVGVSGPGVFIAKADAGGTYQWVINYPGTLPVFAVDGFNIISMVTDAGGDLYVWASYTDPGITPDGDTLRLSGYVLMKINPAGSYLWVKKVPDAADPTTVLGAAAPCGLSIDGAGNVYVAGFYAAGSITIGGYHLPAAPEKGMFLAKYDPSGTLHWVDGLNNGSDGANFFVTGMVVSVNGTIYLEGNYTDTLYDTTELITNPHVDTVTNYLLKMDTGGHVMWVKQYYIPNASFQQMAVDNYDRVYIDISFPGSITYNGVTYTAPATSSNNTLITCLDSSGNAIWAKPVYYNLNGANDPALTVDNCGKLCVSGDMDNHFLLTVAGSDTIYAPPGSKYPMYVAIYDTAGNYLSSVATTTGGEMSNSLTVDERGNFYMCGATYEAPFTAGSDIVADINSTNFFLAKYLYDTDVCVSEITQVNATPAPQETINLYPNPASGSCTIQSATAFAAGATAQLYDMSGRPVGVFELSGYSCSVPVGGLAPGIYLCRIAPGDGTVVIKQLAVE